MKKFMFVFAALALAGTLSAIAGDRFNGTLTVAAGATATSVTQELYRADGPPCVEIDTVFAAMSSAAGTGTVSFAIYEYGETETIATSGALNGGDDYWGRPVATTSLMYTYGVVQNVATGEAGIAVAYLNTQTNYAVEAKSYLGRLLVVSVSQEALAVPLVYRWAAFTKQDPPPKK